MTKSCATVSGEAPPSMTTTAANPMELAAWGTVSLLSPFTSCTLEAPAAVTRFLASSLLEASLDEPYS